MKYIDMLILVIIYSFLFAYFSPQLVFQSEAVAGGDTISHYHAAGFMRESLGKGRISGFSLSWFAGLPMFQFYFQLPFLLIAGLSYVIPLELAFRIITVIGIFSLPASAYLMFKLMGIRKPVIASVLVLPFLFLESHSMYGGNIASTLAGEFCHSIAISLLLVYFGFLYYGIKHRKHIILNSVLLASIALTHVFVAVIAALGSVFFLLQRRLKHNSVYLTKIGLLAFSLSAFWSVPFMAKIGYTTSYNWNQLHNIMLLVPPTLIVFYAVAILGAILYFKDERIRFFMYIVFVSLVVFFALPDGHIWNVRFLPFVYLFMLLLAAIPIKNLLEKTKYTEIFIVLFVLLVLVYANLTTAYTPSWIKWNYEGLEKKEGSFFELTHYLKNLPDGRIFYEYSDSHDRFGSPRAFETIPVFANKPVITGLFVDSSITAPFHFIMQAELSENASCPIMGLSCPDVDIDRGLKHMGLFNIRYFLATSDSVKFKARNHPGFRLLEKIENIEIYEISQTGYIEVPKYRPLTYPRRNWKKNSMIWFEQSNLSYYVVFENSAENMAIKKIDNACEINEELISDEEIIFRTDCTGKPHVIKVSYFPNWKVQGADKVYLVSPSFMLVYPESEHVRLYYGKTFADILGGLLTIFGILIILVVLVRRKLFKR